jgi:hypothetical protein
MKTNLARKDTAAIAALSDEIAAHQAKITELDEDIARAGVAVEAATRLDAELDALTRKRAEHKAAAFVARQPADMAALDEELLALESSTRAVREDGDAAALAIELLQAQRADVMEALRQAEASRKHAVDEWLLDHRDSEIQAYIAAINQAGPHAGEAAAADLARARLFPGHRLGGRHNSYGQLLLRGAAWCDFGIPKGLFIRRREGLEVFDPPIPWLQAYLASGQRQDEGRVNALLAQLREAGVPVPNDSAQDAA